MTMKAPILERRRLLAVLALSLCTGLLAAGAAPAVAQTAYPSRLIELVVPYPPGGTNDVVARIVAENLAAELGQRVIILIMPGASATVGSGFDARAPADGYTLLLGSQGSHSANPYLFAKMPYDAIGDFTPVALVGKVNNVLVVPSTLPIRSVDEFRRYVTQHPGQVNFSHAGAGTSMSLAGELFRLKTGADIVSIPYPGSAPATTALLSGEVQSMFANTTSVIQQIRTGQLRPLGVTGTERDALLPDVKPIAEQGVPGYDIQSWFGLFAPARTPADVVARLNASVRKVLTAPALRQRFAEMGVTPGDLDAAAFRNFVHVDNAAIGRLIRDAGIKQQ
jgi:tripartite-type tricarboxylate transporter receptor subunit TctC